MLTAIYYPMLRKLTYWTIPPNKQPYQCHEYDITESTARHLLREHIIRTESIQAFELFKGRN